MFQNCGKENPGVQISTGSTLYVQYFSSEQIRNGGFLVQWTVVDNPGSTADRACFGTQTLPVNPGDLNGTIVNYIRGVGYRPNSDCTFLITAPTDKYIQITWEYFTLQEMEWFSGTCYDFVSVRDGNQSTGYELQRTCGSWIPLPVTSTQNQVSIQFVSDNAVQSYGFIATWRVVDTPGSVTCSGVKNIFQSPMRGFISDGAKGLGYTNNARCTWMITAPPGLVIAITYVEVQLEKAYGATCHDYLEFWDNLQARPRVCGNLSKSLLDTFGFISSTSNLELRFVSDGNTAAAGFNISYAFVAPPPKGVDNSSKVELVVAVVLLTFFGIILLCCAFVWYKKRQAAKAIQHIDLDRGQDLNRKRTVSGTEGPPPPPATARSDDDIESTGPTPI
jgi:cubilin